MVRVLLVVISVVVALGLLAYLALAHPAASRYLASEIDSLLGPALTLEEVSGSLLGELCVARADYRVPRVTVRAEQLCVRANLWRSFDFLSVSLDSVTARLLEIRTHPENRSASSSGPAGDPAGLDLPVPLEVEILEVAQLQIEGASVTTLTGSLDLSDRALVSSSRFRFAARDWRLTTKGGWKSLTGTATTDGVTVEAEVDLTRAEVPYVVAASAARLDLVELAGRALVLEAVRLSGRGDTAGYRFQTGFELSDPLGTGQVEATGEGDWQGLSLSAARIESARMPTLDLALDELAGRAVLDWSGPWRLTLEELAGHGELQGRSLQATLARAELGQQGLALQGGAIRPGPGFGGTDGELTVNGEIGTNGTLQLRLIGNGLPLTLVDGRIEGQAAGTLSLVGSIDRPLVEGRFVLEDARFQESAAADVSGVVAGGADEGTLVLALESGELGLHTELAYRLHAGGARFSIATATLLLGDTPAGRLQGVLQSPMELSVADGSMEVSETCLTVTVLDDPAAGTVALCGQGSYPQGPAQIRVPVWRFPRWQIPGTRISLTGQVAMEASVTGFDSPAGHIDLHLSELIAHHQDVAPLTLGEADLTLSLASGTAQLLMVAPAGQGLALSGVLSAALATELVQSPIDGRIAMALDGIWTAEALLPMDLAYELEDMRGRLTLDVGLSGTLADPQPSGRLALEDAGWDVVALNAAFREFDLAAEITTAQTIDFESAGQVGDGTLTVSGALGLFDDQSPELAASFELQGAQVVDLPDYSVTVGGGLDLRMSNDALQLSGDLEIPGASFSVAELPETAVSVSADEVLIGDVAAAGPQQIRTTDIRVVLGDRVFLDAFGLETRLTGQLRLREQPGRPQELTGVITLREGLFEAYGQSLTVERGQLTFTGIPEDPTVDVVASRIVNYDGRDYRISLLITGTASNLVTTVRSIPALPEDDALALLITGRTFSQISSTEQTNVSGAALSMGLLSATGITGNLATSLGLEEIIVDQDAEGNMEVGAAVRLNRDVYLRYTYGVFSRLGGVLLRYRLNNRFSVQAKTGDAHSIEIRYGVDD